MKPKYFIKQKTVTYENYWCTDLETTKESMNDSLEQEMEKWLKKQNRNGRTIIFGNDSADHNDINNSYFIVMRRLIVEESWLLNTKPKKDISKRKNLSQLLTIIVNKIKSIYED